MLTCWSQIANTDHPMPHVESFRAWRPLARELEQASNMNPLSGTTATPEVVETTRHSARDSSIELHRLHDCGMGG